MTHLRFVPHTLAASAVLALSMLAPGQARALVAPPDGSSGCEVNGCPMGFECTVVGTSTCDAAAPVPTCPPGETCEPAPMPEPCTNLEIRACTPAHCTSDADCAAGMVCHTSTSTCPMTDCACPNDVPDCKCDPAPACEPETVSMCTPRYVLPCEAAIDCGEGFTCEEEQSCGCGGSAGGGTDPAPGAGFAPLPPEGSAGAPAERPAPEDPLPPDCSCEPSGVFMCVPREIACDDASDCPTGWICQQEAQADAPACAGAGCPTPQPLPPARFLCQPEYYGGGGGIDNGGIPVSGGPGGGTGTSNPEGAPNPSPNTGSGEESRESAACQMGRAPASSGVLSLLVVLGALFGLKRRRA